MQRKVARAARRWVQFSPPRKHNKPAAFTMMGTEVLRRGKIAASDYAPGPLSDNIFSNMGFLLIAGIRLLEFLFVVGVIGSAIVLVLTGIEDVETLIGRDQPSHTKT
jgi:hypothetical protein